MDQFILTNNSKIDFDKFSECVASAKTIPMVYYSSLLLFSPASTLLAVGK